MSFPRNRMVWAIMLVLILQGTDAARTATDQGMAAVSPWSGPWWPQKSGGLIGPLTKYDQAVKSNAARWEREHHQSTAIETWFGHCHAWAASSVTEAEPRSPRRWIEVDFGIGDLKGLLATCHTQDVANTYGDRFGDCKGSEDRRDLAPDQLWMLLQLFVRQQRLPLILDLESGEEVWNYPVYQYQVDYRDGDSGSDRRPLSRCSGQQRRPRVRRNPACRARVHFPGQARDGAVVLGSGEWTGNSVQDHPDFAWYRLVALAGTRKGHTDVVSKILGSAVGETLTGPNLRPATRIEPSAAQRTEPSGTAAIVGADPVQGNIALPGTNTALKGRLESQHLSTRL